MRIGPESRLPAKKTDSDKEAFEASLRSIGEALRALEKAGWGKDARSALHDQIGKLTTQARLAGQHGAVGTLRALSSLLALPAEEFQPGRVEVPEKVFDLLDLLEGSWS